MRVKNFEIGTGSTYDVDITITGLTTDVNSASTNSQLASAKSIWDLNEDTSEIVAGSDTEIQFNNSGSLDADGTFYYDYTNSALTMGYRTGTTGVGSVVMGGVYKGIERNEASGVYSHSEGASTSAIGEVSHSEGNETTANGSYSHSEGDNTSAIGISSHSEGRNTTAIGEASYSGGFNTTASAHYSHAEGRKTTASGEYSHSEGYFTIAASYAEHVQGKYNYTGDSAIYNSWVETDQLFVIGNGASDLNRNNALTVYKNGNTEIDTQLTIKSTGKTQLVLNDVDTGSQYKVYISGGTLTSEVI